jgi:hypothetical protein
MVPAISLLSILPGRLRRLDSAEQQVMDSGVPMTRPGDSARRKLKKVLDRIASARTRCNLIRLGYRVDSDSVFDYSVTVIYVSDATKPRSKDTRTRVAFH